jgi:hypothetical protein
VALKEDVDAAALGVDSADLLQQARLWMLEHVDVVGPDLRHRSSNTRSRPTLTAFAGPEPGLLPEGLLARRCGQIGMRGSGRDGDG